MLSSHSGIGELAGQIQVNSKDKMKGQFNRTSNKTRDGCDANILVSIVCQLHRTTRSVARECTICKGDPGQRYWTYLNAVAEQRTSVQLSNSCRAAMTKRRGDKMSGVEKKDGTLRHLEGYKTASRRSSLR